jgi:trk system potassium uptake protein TrkH
MLDLRPVGYVIGLLVAALGAAMAAPLAVDLLAANGNWSAFAVSGAAAVAAGVMLAASCRGSRREGLSVQQTFMLTTSVWVALPVFGALPFTLGAPEASYTDAFFEAMSGLTTTGSTVFSNLDAMPAGTLLWRALLQWFGGVGVIIVALAFLPSLRVGGMQLFRSESFDTFGKILPRAAEIAARISAVYIALTALCAVVYATLGMTLFDAVSHAMTTIATGGFANYDASFAAFPPAVEYAAATFLVLASLPFVRYVQLLAGTARPLWRDPQVRAFLSIAAVVVVALALWRAGLPGAGGWEQAFRKALFNGVSILTGAGYASEDYGRWGTFPVAVFFVIGLIGGCAGSTCCAIKVFRFQVLGAAIWAQARSIHSPSGVFIPRFGGRPVDESSLSSVMSFFYLFALTLGVVTVALSMMGLAPITAISGAATALANVGPGLGPEIGPAGNFAGLPDEAKWLLSAAMLVGRLEILSVFVLFTWWFWRA